MMQQKMLSAYNYKIHCFSALNHFGHLSLMLNCKTSITPLWWPHFGDRWFDVSAVSFGLACLMLAFRWWLVLIFCGLQDFFYEPFGDFWILPVELSSLFVAVFLLLFSTESSFTHLNVPDPCIIPWINKTNVPKNTPSSRVNESKKNTLDLSLFLELMGSILGQYPSSIQVLWKSIL